VLFCAPAPHDTHGRSKALVDAGFGRSRSTSWWVRDSGLSVADNSGARRADASVSAAGVGLLLHGQGFNAAQRRSLKSEGSFAGFRELGGRTPTSTGFFRGTDLPHAAVLNGAGDRRESTQAKVFKEATDDKSG